MTKKQNWLFVFDEKITLIALVIVTLLCFLLYVPKVASSLFPWRRQMILQGFLQASTKTQDISPQEFWQFREFYSPGYYTFNRTGLSQAQIEAVKKKLGITFVDPQRNTVFLTFSSPHLISLEALVVHASIKDVVSVGALTIANQLINKSNEKVFRADNGNVYIIFVKPLSEMEKANGFFDYTGVDKDIVEGKYWLDITKLDGK